MVPDIIMASLESLQTNLCCALSNKGALIFWSVQTSQLNYLITEDQAVYKQELKNIVKNLQSGDFYLRASSGPSMIFEGRSLYPILLELNPDEEYQCPAYFLLMQQGLVDHCHYVPYWFTSESSRDNALSFIHSKLA